MVRVQLTSWDEVANLCGERSAGAVYVTVSGPELNVGDRVNVFVEMPDGLRLSLDGEVACRRPGPHLRWSVELVGMTSELAARLTALADAVPCDDGALARGSKEWPTAAVAQPKAPNLRNQIESLADKMKG